MWDEDLGYHLENDEITIHWTRVRADSKLNEQSRLPAEELRVFYDEWEDFVVSSF